MYDCEPETQATVVSRRRTIRLPKAIEDVRQKVGIDPDAGVFHNYLDVRIDALQRDLDQPTLARKLHAVRQQVPNHLLQSLAIAKHWSNVRFEQHLQANSLASAVGRILSAAASITE